MVGAHAGALNGTGTLYIVEQSRSKRTKRVRRFELKGLRQLFCD